MNEEVKRALSKYTYIKDINREHGIALVRLNDTEEYYVRKVTTVYNRFVYDYIMHNPVKGVPAVKELIEDDDKLVIIEQYIAGHTLQEMLDSQGRISPDEVVSITIKLLDILVHFHQNYPPIVHRDIKPSNVILGRGSTVWLIDFNAAKFVDPDKSEDTELIGTRGYAAPEQYGFGSSTERTDVYAIGMMMQELISGANEENVSIHPHLATVIKKCINLEPNDRYEGAYALKEALVSAKYAIENGLEMNDNNSNDNTKPSNNSHANVVKKHRIKPYNVFVISAVVLVAASIISRGIDYYRMYKPAVSEITKSFSPEYDSALFKLVEENGKTVDINGQIYTFMPDDWTLYTAVNVSNDIIKITEWSKNIGEEQQMEYKKDLGTYKTDGSDDTIEWLDDSHTSFSIKLKKNDNDKLRKAMFYTNTCNAGEIRAASYTKGAKCYAYSFDKWHYYVAVPVKEDLMKIECWGKDYFNYSVEFDHDLMVVDPKANDVGFEWINDEKSSFAITTHDEGYAEWSEDKLVVFEAVEKK